jgi:hypothetical protein
METLLKQSLPAIDQATEPSQDLWPAVLQRMDCKPVLVPWFDWALLAGLVGMTAVFPAAIPVFLYYL